MNNITRTVLITGGGGFLGINLLRTMVSRGWGNIYIVLDNFITSDPANINRVVQELTQNYSIFIDVIAGDVCDSNVIMGIRERYSTIDEIWHLASLASPPFYKRFPIETLDVGYVGMRNMLELCRYYTEQNMIPPKLLYTSTSEVYGDAKQHPQSEGYYGNVNSFGERSCYDESKRIGESLIYSYNRLYNLDTRIVRIFNTYGPYMCLGDGRIVTEIIRCLKTGSKLTIFGSGEQTRSLGFVGDTVDMMLRIMNSECREPVNVGNDKEITINELVKLTHDVYNRIIGKTAILDICHKTTDIDIDDPKIRKPDLSRNRETIGETTFTRLEDGLTSTINYFLHKD